MAWVAFEQLELRTAFFDEPDGTGQPMTDRERLLQPIDEAMRARP